MTRSLTLILLAPLLGSASFAQAVHVVTSDGPTMAQAIAAAQDGDVVLVRAATAGAIAVNGKSISVVADVGFTPTVSSLTVENVPAGGRVVVRGFLVDSAIGSGALANVRDNAGSVWLEETRVVVRPFLFLSPLAAVRVAASAHVTARACIFEPADAIGGLTGRGHGLLIEGSAVALFDVTCRGGEGVGGTMGGIPPGPGGSGVRLETGSLFASGSTFVGGVGGIHPFSVTPLPGGAGGDAIVVGGAAVLRDCTFVPGAGGFGTGGQGPAGQPATILPGGTIQTLAGAARHFSISTPVEETQNATYTASGLPGEGVGVLFSLAPIQGTPFPFFDGVLALDLGASGDAFFLGNVPVGGTLVATAPMPGLPPPFQGVTFFEQSFFFDLPPTYLTLGPSSSLVILDDSL